MDRREAAVEFLRGPLAQWLEQGTHNPLVVGSNPTGPTKYLCGFAGDGRKTEEIPDLDLRFHIVSLFTRNQIF